jgi:hypothetical protein
MEFDVTIKLKNYIRCEPTGIFSHPSTPDVLVLKKNENFGFHSISNFGISDK